jgi:hypothetical protein
VHLPADQTTKQYSLSQPKPHEKLQKTSFKKPQHAKPQLATSHGQQHAKLHQKPHHEKPYVKPQLAKLHGKPRIADAHGNKQFFKKKLFKRKHDHNETAGMIKQTHCVYSYYCFVILLCHGKLARGEIVRK